jgi:hypothetical protein
MRCDLRPGGTWPTPLPTHRMGLADLTDVRTPHFMTDRSHDPKWVIRSHDRRYDPQSSPHAMTDAYDPRPSPHAMTRRHRPAHDLRRPAPPPSCD